MSKNKNKICPNCEKKFVGCHCIRTMANNGIMVHKTCKDEYESNLKNKKNDKEKRS
tara:strand:+ start:1081 stop:1248 length:168 start_codon:yes stop_codon:yes gene_type:complete